MYDDGILVNGPVVMSTTLTFATLGLSILGVLLQVLAGIFAASGGGYLAKEKGRRGLAAASRIVGIASLAFGGYQIALLIPAFRFVFCDLNAVLPRKHSARQSRKPPVCKGLRTRRGTTPCPA